MSSIASSPVALEVGFVWPGSGDPGPDVDEKVYIVQTASPERIEAVNLTVSYDTHVLSHDYFVLRLVDQTGEIVFTQASPLFDPSGTGGGSVDGPATWELTWSRRGTGTDQLAPNIPGKDIDPPPNLGYWTGLLPDAVLQPNSYVALQRFVVLEGGNLVVTVPALTVTVTRNPGGADESTLTDTTPLWIPIPLDEQG